MAQREKRSISLPPALASAIDEAAAEEGTSVSAWLAESAARRLRLEDWQRVLAEWETEHGALTDDERAEARAVVRESLGRPPLPRS